MQNPMIEFVRLAFIGAGGSIKGAAEKLRWSVGELLEHLARTPGMREFLATQREAMADDAESYLEAAVNESCPWAIKFTLNTLGVHRGYGKPTPDDALTPKPALDPMASPREPESPNGSPTRERGSDAAESANGSPTRERGSDAAEQLAEAERLMQGKSESEMAAALEAAGGKVSRAAIKLNMAHADVRKIVAARPNLQAIIVEARQRLVDKAEIALNGALNEKKAWAIKYVLRMFGFINGFGQPARKPQRPRAPAKPLASTPNASSRIDECPGAGAAAPTIQASDPKRTGPDKIDRAFMPEGVSMRAKGDANY
jgi:hypothetical protein